MTNQKGKVDFLTTVVITSFMCDQRGDNREPKHFDNAYPSSRGHCDVTQIKAIQVSHFHVNQFLILFQSNESYVL